VSHALYKHVPHVAGIAQSGGGREADSGGADDYDHAIQIAGGVIAYDVDALVLRDDTVGPLPT
jgi:hypothetical protein